MQPAAPLPSSSLLLPFIQDSMENPELNNSQLTSLSFIRNYLIDTHRETDEYFGNWNRLLDFAPFDLLRFLFFCDRQGHLEKNKKV